MKSQSHQLLLLLSCLFLMSGCAAPKPILYPNTHFRQVGESVAEQDIEDCSAMAKEAGATPSQGKSGQVAGSTTAGGAIGSAAGAVGGAVVGHPGGAVRWSERRAGPPVDCSVACFGSRRRVRRSSSL